MKLVIDEPVGQDLTCSVVMIVMFKIEAGDSVTLSHCHRSSLSSQLKSVEEEILYQN